MRVEVIGMYSIDECQQQIEAELEALRAGGVLIITVRGQPRVAVQSVGDLRRILLEHHRAVTAQVLARRLREYRANPQGFTVEGAIQELARRRGLRGSNSRSISG